MLKRIAVANHREMAKALEALGRAHEVEVVALSPGEPLPAATSAVAGSPEGAPALYEAALALAKRNEQLLRLLAQAIDCREEFDPGSSERVWEHAVRFAEALQLSASDRLTFERGALVRDIGKLQVPNDILLKDAILTYDEWETIRRHPSLGAALVRRTEVLADVADIVHYHHESYDGTGYPEGLEGESIPLLSRAMRILDVYCAMTSRRRYREGKSTADQALEHLREDSGTRFDPELVRIFIDAGVAAPSDPAA